MNACVHVYFGRAAACSEGTVSSLRVKEHTLYISMMFVLNESAKQSFPLYSTLCLHAMEMTTKSNPIPFYYSQNPVVVFCSIVCAHVAWGCNEYRPDYRLWSI